MFELFFVCGEGCNEDALLESKAIFQQSCPNSIAKLLPFPLTMTPSTRWGGLSVNMGPGWQKYQQDNMREISVKVLVLLYFATATLHIQGITVILFQ